MSYTYLIALIFKNEVYFISGTTAKHSVDFFETNVLTKETYFF